MKKNNITIVLTAGGESSRFKNVPGAANVQKSAYQLPNGETMIERTINMYKKAGFTDFAILLYHNAESVKILLGDGSKYGVNIKYSVDPEKPVGRGGAVKHAFNQGVLTPENYLIVHNPDDQIIGDSHNKIINIFEKHLELEKNGALATAVMVPGVKYEFTGFSIGENGFVKDVEMYPYVNIPAHIGLTVFSPNLKTRFDELFDLNVKTDFEAVLFPLLVKEGKLASCFIDDNSWISVNDEKGLKKFLKAIESDKS